MTAPNLQSNQPKPVSNTIADRNERAIRLVFNGANIAGAAGGREAESEYLITKGLASKITWGNYIPELITILDRAVENRNDSVIKGLIEVAIQQQIKITAPRLWQDLISYLDGKHSKESEARIELALTWALGSYQSLPREMPSLLYQIATDGGVLSEWQEPEAKRWPHYSRLDFEVSKTLAVLILMRVDCIEALKALSLAEMRSRSHGMILALQLWREHRASRGHILDLRVFNSGGGFSDPDLAKVSSLVSRLSGWPQVLVSAKADRASQVSASVCLSALTVDKEFQPRLRTQGLDDYGAELVKIIESGDRLAVKGARQQLLRSRELLIEQLPKILELLEKAEKGPIWSKLRCGLGAHNFAAIVALAVNSSEIRYRYPHQVFRIVCRFNDAAQSASYFSVAFFNSPQSERLFNVATRAEKAIFFVNFERICSVVSHCSLNYDSFEQHILRGLSDPSLHVRRAAHNSFGKYIVRILRSGSERDIGEFLRQAEVVINEQRVGIRSAFIAAYELCHAGWRAPRAILEALSGVSFIRYLNSRERALRVIEFARIRYPGVKKVSDGNFVGESERVSPREATT